MADVTYIHSNHYGRGGELQKLNADRNDPSKPKWQRSGADKAHAKIVRQMKDKHLMGMRERLLRAARAGDKAEIDKITKQMRDYTREDRESGYGE